MAYTTGPALGADENEVYNLLCALEGQALPRQPFQRAYHACLRAPGHLLLAARRDGAAVGFLHMRWEVQLHHAAPVAEIMELAVAEDCRGAGLGTALLSAAAAGAMQAGCTLLEVCSNAARGRAHAFYEGRGFARSHFKFTFPLEKL